MRTWNPWTIPNALTATRIVIAIGVIIAAIHLRHHDLYASQLLMLGLLAFAFLTDWLDGLIARRWPSQKSKLGEYLDPPADKLAVFAGMIFLFMLGVAGSWFELLCFGLIIIRESIMMFRRARYGADSLPVNNFGKWKAASQMAALLAYGCIPSVPLVSAPASALLLTATVLTMLSFFSYKRRQKA